MFQSISRIQKSCLLMDDLELINSWQMTMLMFSILNVNDERLITWSKVCSAIIIHSNTSYNSCYQIELLKVFTKLNIFGLVLADCITVTSKHGNFQYKASSNDMTLGATCGLYFITDPDKRIEIEITHLELSCEGGIISVSLSLISYQKKKKKKTSRERSVKITKQWETTQRFDYWNVDSWRLGNERRIFPITTRSPFVAGWKDCLRLWKRPAQESFHLLSKRSTRSVPRPQTRTRIFHQSSLLKQS